MLDEFLPLLLPNQETTKSLTSRPLAPAPTSTAPSSSYLTPATTSNSISSLKRPIRTQMSGHQPQSRVAIQSGQQEARLSSRQPTLDSRAQIPTKFSTMHSSMTPGQIVSAHQHHQQKTTVQIPASHSFNYPGIENSQSSLSTSSANTQSFSTANLLQANQTGYHQIGHLGRQEGNSSNCANFLNQAMLNATSVRFVTIGNDVLTNSTILGREDGSAESHNADFCIQQVTLPSQVYSHFGTTVPTSTSPPLTSYLANSLTSAVGHEKVAMSSSISSPTSPSSSLTSMSINVSTFLFRVDCLV